MKRRRDATTQELADGDEAANATKQEPAEAAEQQQRRSRQLFAPLFAG